MYCRYGICMDESTGETDGPACDAWTREHGMVEAAGDNTCGETCVTSDDCATNLFCCPNWSLCMDTTTYSTVGPMCDIAGGLASSPDAPTTYDGYAQIGTNQSCDAPHLELGYFNQLEECAAACLNLGNCHYFIWDGSNCIEVEATSRCENSRIEMPYFNFYELYQEESSVPRPHPSDGLGYWEVGEF